MIWTVIYTELANEVQFNVYLNPAKDDVIIELPDGNNAKGVIYNLNGEAVISFEMNGTDKLSLNGIMAGIYILHIATEEHVFKSKMVILK